MASRTKTAKRNGKQKGKVSIGHGEFIRTCLGNLDPAEINYIPHNRFRSRKIESELWGDSQPEIEVPRYSLFPHERQQPKTRNKKRPRSLSSHEEETLFLRYNYAKYRLQKLLKRTGRGDGQKHADKLITWRDRAQQAHRKIVHANLPLVPAMAKRKINDGVEFSEKVSEGYMAVLRSVEHFDISRGYKFSTYACRAILACFQRMASKAQTYRKHVPSRYEPEFERDDYGQRRHDEQRSFAIEAVQRVLEKNLAGLNKAEFKVICQRFPLSEDKKPRPLCEIGRRMRLSTERIRQIEKSSLKKIHEAVEDYLAA